MIISTVMHWLTSETMFVVEFYQSELGLQSHFGINYSPLLFLLSVYCWLFSSVRYRSIFLFQSKNGCPLWVVLH